MEFENEALAAGAAGVAVGAFSEYKDLKVLKPWLEERDSVRANTSNVSSALSQLRQPLMEAAFERQKIDNKSVKDIMISSLVDENGPTRTDRYLGEALRKEAKSIIPDIEFIDGTRDLELGKGKYLSKAMATNVVERLLQEKGSIASAINSVFQLGDSDSRSQLQNYFGKQGVNFAQAVRGGERESIHNNFGFTDKDTALRMRSNGEGFWTVDIDQGAYDYHSQRRVTLYEGASMLLGNTVKKLDAHGEERLFADTFKNRTSERLAKLGHGQLALGTGLLAAASVYGLAKLFVHRE